MAIHSENAASKRRPPFWGRLWANGCVELETQPIQATAALLGALFLFRGGGATIETFMGAAVSEQTPQWQYIAFGICLGGLLGTLSSVIMQKRALLGVCAYLGLLGLGFTVLQDLISKVPNSANIVPPLGWGFGLIYCGLFCEAVWARIDAATKRNPSMDDGGQYMAAAFAMMFIAIATAAPLSGLGPQTVKPAPSILNQQLPESLVRTTTP
jgi:hypothetical protein